MVSLKSDRLVQELGPAASRRRRCDVEVMRQHYETVAPSTCSPPGSARYGGARRRRSRRGTAPRTGDHDRCRGRRRQAHGPPRRRLPPVPLRCRRKLAARWRLLSALALPSPRDGEVLRYAEPCPVTWEQHRAILDAIIRDNAEAAMSEPHGTSAAQPNSFRAHSGTIGSTVVRQQQAALQGATWLPAPEGHAGRSRGAKG